MRIVVGCPVRDRAWMLPTWFEYVEAALKAIEVEPEYAFVLGNSTDNSHVILEEHTNEDRDSLVLSFEPEIDLSQNRNWNTTRYQEMADCRNQLLNLVREMQPDYFLSLDSDILLNPETLPLLLEDLREHEDWWAVGGKCYMTPAGRWAPSYGFGLPMGGLDRPDIDGVLPVEIIMAIKLMTPKAYNVDYTTHDKGEDVAWSTSVRQAGGKLGFDARTTNKHCMTKRMLVDIDPRCGY